MLIIILHLEVRSLAGITFREENCEIQDIVRKTLKSFPFCTNFPPFFPLHIFLILKVFPTNAWNPHYAAYGSCYQVYNAFRISLISLVVTSFFSFLIDIDTASQVIPKYLSFTINQSPYFCSIPQNGLPLLPLYEWR